MTGSRQEAGDRRWETGARGRRETWGRQKTGDGIQCSDVKSRCTKIEILLFWKKKY